MDRDFRDRFPSETWLDVNLFRLLGAPQWRRRETEVTVENGTAHRVACLEIEAVDLFLFLDVPPASRRVIMIPNNTDDGPTCFRVNVRGENGAAVSSELKCFSKPPRGDNTRYAVTAKPGQVVVEIRA